MSTPFVVCNYLTFKYTMNDIDKILTKEEKDFITAHGLSTNDFYDARGLRYKEVREIAKEHDCRFVIYNYCNNGHRLKTRSGHCIVCRPANIAFQNRENLGGVIYVACGGKYCKVGITEEKDKSNKESLEDREYRLNSEGGYAGCSNWKYIKIWNVERNLGRIEREAHRLLEEYKVEKLYWYSGELRTTKELFECSIQAAVDAVNMAIELYK